MADQKISELTSTTPQDADNVAIERGALTNWKVSYLALRTWLETFFDTAGSSDGVQSNLDAHTSDGTIHYTEDTIDHGAIQGLGDDDHPQYHNDARGDARYYPRADADAAFDPAGSADAVQTNLDTHTSDGTIHFTQGSIDHTAIQNVGTNTHVQLDAHVADAGIHFQDTITDGKLYGRRDQNWEALAPVVAGLPYSFSTNTATGSNPGAGFTRLNNTSFSLATQAAISTTDGDGVDQSTRVNNSKSGDIIIFRDDSDPTKVGTYTLSANPILQAGFTQYPLTYVSDEGGGLPADQAPIHLQREGVSSDLGQDNDGANIGAGSGQWYQGKAGVTLNFRTARSSDGSVQFTTEADTVNITATGAGGGEANAGENLGVGEGVYVDKNGINLTFKGFDAGQFQSTPDTISITSGTFAPFTHVGAIGLGEHGQFDPDDGGFVPPPGAGSGTRVLQETGAWVERLQDVIDDTTPQLGGDLETKGTSIRLTRSDDSLRGLVGAFDAIDGSALFYSDDGAYVLGDGAFIALHAAVQVDGIVTMHSLSHSDDAGREVHVSEDGTLYSAPLPDPGWLELAVDTGSYDLGTGTGPGTWVKVTDLEVNPGADVPAGSRLDYSFKLWADNKTTNRTGRIDVGLGINGAAPALPPTEGGGIGAGFSGYIAGSGFHLAAAPYTTTDTFAIWARINDGSNAAFGVDLVGSPNQHEFGVSTPAAGGGGGDVIAGTPFVAGDMVAVETGNTIQSVGFAAADVLLDPMTADGDLITQQAGVPAKVGIGADGEVLTVSGGAPTWAPSAGGAVPNRAVFRTPSTYAIPGAITPGTTLPFFIPSNADTATRLYAAFFELESSDGSTVTFDVVTGEKGAEVGVTGLIDLIAGDTVGTALGAAGQVSNGQRFALTSKTVTGSPIGLSVTLVIQHEVTLTTV